MRALRPALYAFGLLLMLAAAYAIQCTYSAPEPPHVVLHRQR